MSQKQLQLMRNTVGTTSLKIPSICFGTSGLGSMPETYGYSVSEEQAEQTLRAVFQSDAPFIDTSRNYGGQEGESERRIGNAFRAVGGKPADVVISTKLDRDMTTGRFDAARARQSLEESLQAMGVDRVQILHLHDPEHAASVAEIVGKGGAMEALVKMKEEGLADAIGLAAGDVDTMLPILTDWDLDALVTHNRFTLLNRNAQPLLDIAKSKGIAVLNAAPYGSGILVQGSAACPKYAYQSANSELLVRVEAIETLCAAHNVDLGAAALQFSMRHEGISSTICGVTKPERIEQTLNWATTIIPDEFWAAVEALPFSTDNPEANRDYRPG